ncbi:dUTPase [compost metagenome]
MINEWRGFKHWSKDQEPRRAKMLTEASDCLHFFLSIARQLNIPPEQLGAYDDFVEGNTSAVLTELFFSISKIGLSDKYENKVKFFRVAWHQFLNISEQRLQIYFEDLYNAYLEKNAENHSRQDNNY